MQLWLPNVCTEMRHIDLVMLKTFFHCTNLVENFASWAEPGRPVIPEPKHSLKWENKIKLTHIKKFPLSADLPLTCPLSWVRILFHWGASPQRSHWDRIKNRLREADFSAINTWICFGKQKNREETRDARRERENRFVWEAERSKGTHEDTRQEVSREHRKLEAGWGFLILL